VEIRDRVTVVTGAASGIGQATARALHARGARLHLVDIQKAPLEALCTELNATAHIVDVSDADAVERLAERVLAAIIVNTASILGLLGVPNSAAYCASKFGVVGLSEALDAELSPQGVRVLAVCPGLIATDIVARGDVKLPGRSQAEVEARWAGGHHPKVIATAVVRAIEGERARTIAPFDGRVLTWLRYLPTSWRNRLLHLGRRYV
jgi:short-subunit dehydrogenase